MRFKDSFVTAKQRSSSAQEAMDRLKVPGHPDNYLVWYEYAARENRDLAAYLDKLIADGVRFDDKVNTEIFNKHFGIAEDDDYAALSFKIEAVAGQMLSAMNSAGEDAAEYGARLKSFTGDIQGVRSVADFEKLIAGLVASTRAMGEHVNHLQTRLSESTSQIGQLQTNLARARAEAMTDALTGVANRHGFDRALRLATEVATQERQALSLIMMDLDHFKRFNDTYGHPIGDQVLKLVGRTLISSIKGQDTAARYGGEEFAVILPATDIKSAAVVAENIRQSVAKKRIVRKDSGEALGSISLSLGIGQYKLGEPMADLIERAVAALYAAKHRGRNRVVTEAELSAAA
ncbi:MAG: GGDEF domain-containing protein [Alphaproteobacteria bacterium]|nr:GGDEF domain-containing protein [Alphaproteobacteria bacterium]